MTTDRSRSELLLASLFLMSPAAGILVHFARITTLRTSLLFFTPPATVAAGLLVLRAVRDPFGQVAVWGMLGGLAATFAYDATRLALRWTGLAGDPFKSIQAYGLLIAGMSRPALAAWAGWAFHVWNGVTFGLFFALAFGRPTWLKGILWGLFLELALVATSPTVLRLTIQGELLASSLLGHVAYGIALAEVVAWGTMRREIERAP